MAETPHIKPGVYPMLYSFFGSDGSLRLDSFRHQIDAALTAGCAGVAVLGLATEVSKLTPAEREATLTTVAEHLAGDAALMVTVFGETPDQQIEFARTATELGADWLTLQPPPNQMGESELFDFFSEVVGSLKSPLGIQNAPEFIGYGLSNEAIESLAQRYSNFMATKLECPAADLAEVAEKLGSTVALFNGRCGLELPDNLRAGASGVVPSIESADVQNSVYQAFASGDQERADKLYADILPVIASIMQGVPHLVAYGKLLAAERLGIEPCSGRGPQKSLTSFGTKVTKQQAARLGPLE